MATLTTVNATGTTAVPLTVDGDASVTAPLYTPALKPEGSAVTTTDDGVAPELADRRSHGALVLPVQLNWTDVEAIDSDWPTGVASPIV